jgi:hypothetical protein
VTREISDNERKAVKGWLASGAALELYVADTLQRRGFAVDYSALYRDVTEDKLRETDVIARRSNWNGSVGLGLQLVIECKGATSPPWILVKAPDDRHLYEDAGLRDLTKIRATAGVDSARLDHLYRTPLFYFPTFQWHAARLTVAGKEKDSEGRPRGGDAAYDALTQCMDALEGVAAEWQTTQNGKLRLDLFLPVIVTSAPLIKLTPDGTPEPPMELVDFGLLLTRSKVSNTMRPVYVVQAEALDAFAALAVETVSGLSYA